jgi:hypothetical protein
MVTHENRFSKHFYPIGCIGCALRLAVLAVAPDVFVVGDLDRIHLAATMLTVHTWNLRDTRCIACGGGGKCIKEVIKHARL